MSRNYAAEFLRFRNSQMYRERDWTTEQVEQLIATYQQLPALWKPTSRKRGLENKYVAWKNLAAAFQCDLEHLKKKMQSVLASYRREKSKVQGGNRSYWFLYDRFSFLPNYIPNIPGPANAVEVSLRSEVSRDSEVSREPEVRREPERREPERREPERREPEVRREAEFRREGVVRRIEKDECDSFGEYIAMSLRKHDERTRATMEQAITNIIFEFELKKFCNNTYTDVQEVNPLNV